MTLDNECSLSIRQLAAVLLRQYIDSHWSQDGEKFRAPETTPNAKAMIRQMLPMGLKDQFVTFFISKYGMTKSSNSMNCMMSNSSYSSDGVVNK